MPSRSITSVAFVSCREVGGITPDDASIAQQLEAQGVRVRPVLWDEQEPPAVDAIVIRSPWDYHLRPEAFLEWIDRAGDSAPVYNAPAMVRWNAHKRYLLDLERAGVPIAPTIVCARGQSYDLRAIMAERGWHDAVVKPAISASSYMTAIVGATPHPALQTGELRSRFVEDGQAHLDRILETRDALVQPFLPEIFTRGERSLIYIGGTYSHCVQKDAFTTGPGGGRAVEAAPEERTVAERALDTLAETPLYARVDLLRGGDGNEYLMELELIDPELYMRYAPEAAETFAVALMKQ